MTSQLHNIHVVFIAFLAKELSTAAEWPALLAKREPFPGVSIRPARRSCKINNPPGLRLGFHKSLQ
jgi:hypothetical protein